MPRDSKIQIRKGTSSEWSSANPILALGEPGFDTTNNQIRIGNGTSNWNDLPVIGAQGTQGIQGTQGVQGNQGTTGLQGNTGNQGTQGLQGIQGLQGLQGQQGTIGIQGNQGLTGTQGLVGSQGAQGIQGLQGLQGLQGNGFMWAGTWDADTTYYPSEVVIYLEPFTGYGNTYIALTTIPDGNDDPPINANWALFTARGAQGIQGTQGLTGSQGSLGNNGSQGVQGLTGSQGLSGTNGAQGTQGTQGTTGSQGTQGIQGRQGIQGTQGLQGAQGLQGVQGEIGLQGTAGSDASMQGTQGIQGEYGIQGEQGLQGYEGYQGIQGYEGPQGAIQTISVRGEYDSWTTYYLNDIVSYNGMAYAAIQDGFSNYDPTNSSYWALFISQTIQGIQGVQGDQGPPAVVNWTGEYSSFTYYNQYDGISYNGSSYVAIQSTYSNDPTNTGYWQLIAAQGIQGLDGIQGFEGLQGVQGEQGIQGYDGAQGPAAAINWLGEYNSSNNYYPGDGVSYEGSSYVSLSSSYSIDPTNTGYWQLISAQGIQGIQGLDGVQGSIPTLNFRGEYVSGTTYYLNDIVAYGYQAYAAIQDGFSFIDPTNSSYWAVFVTQTVQGIQGEGIQGIQGEQGIQGYEGYQGVQGSAAAINWTGEYNSGTTYYINDGVSYNGSSYVALQYSSGNDPTNGTYWQLIASQGVQGLDGIQGFQGESVQGTQGESGIQGFSGSQGTNGSQGIQGRQGTQGFIGSQGTSGSNGTNGSQGTQGTQGNTGTNGSQGTIGSQGIQGIQGSQGIQGFYGIQGVQGIQGTTPSLNGQTLTNCTIHGGTP